MFLGVGDERLGERAPHRGIDEIADLVAEFSDLIPVTVICEMLGVPHEDHERCRAWSEEIALAIEPVVPDDLLRRADADGYAWVITMDCDEQHEPEQIPDFVRAIERGDADVVSGSRYLRADAGDDAAPEARRRVNAAITRELNERLDLGLTDAFCGFKAYRTAAVRHFFGCS